MKKQAILLLIFFIGFFTYKNGQAQCDHQHHQHQLEKQGLTFQSCILDEVVRKHVKQTPNALDKYIIFEENKKMLIEQLREGNTSALANTKGTDTLIDGKRVIPVVFHVIHKYGLENISRAQVEDAIERLNIDYNKQNPDTADTYPLFKSRAADTRIEFRLARIDPWGNCTDGINRVYDKRTDFAYFSVMSDNAWPYSMYMNVYAVNFIYPEGMILPPGAVIGGLSPFTPDNPLSPTMGDTLLDGVLVRHDCVGAIGTAQSMAGSGVNNFNRVMTHETGHFFNLYHPFQNIVAQILGLDNCLHISFLGLNGDEVDDTPPTKEAVMGCPTPGSLNTCPTTDIPGFGIEPDMIENFMDYASGQCQNIFTEGQLERVDATLMGTRRHIWSYENLVATGVLDTMPLACAPIADFNVNRKMICEGASVNFTDFSFNGDATQWEWIFPGGTPATSTDQNPSVSYDTQGHYDVTLIASNSNGSDTLTRQNYIYVGDGQAGIQTPFFEGFEASNALDDWKTIDSETGVSKWERTSEASYTNNYSLKLNSYDALVNSEEAIITPAFDLTDLDHPRLKFQLAYQGRTMSDPFGGPDMELYGNLTISVSTNCGATWMPRRIISGANLSTAGLDDSEFIPTSQTQWREEIVAGLSIVANSPNVMFKFQFKHEGGNNMFIDDIEIYNDNVGIDDGIADFLNLNIYPNPVTKNSVIEFTLERNANINISLVDILGKEISTLHDGLINAGTHSMSVGEATDLAPGVYFVNFSFDTNTIFRRIVVY